jgi:hypothetical protein
MYGHKSEPSLERFMVIEGQAKIYSKISQMINSTQNKLSIVCSIERMLNVANQGFFDAAIKHQQKTKFCILTDIKTLNSLAVKKFLYILDRSLFLRYTTDTGKNPFPQMLISDCDEALFLISSKNNDHYQSVCIWTNSKALVWSFCLLFENIWDNSSDVSKKLLESVLTNKAV